MRKVVILGAGGDGLVVAEAIFQINKSVKDSEKILVQGFLDDAYIEKAAFMQFTVHGKIDSWKYIDEEVFFIPALQKVGDMPRRIARIQELNIPMERWISVIHPSAVIASDVKLGVGIYIGAFCSIQPKCEIGNFSTLRAGAALGHDVVLSNHVYVGPNAVLCGKSSMQDGSHLGPGSVVLDNCTVGKFAVVGVCSSVTKNVSDNAVVMGNPAKRINKFLK
jgi:acetyltransferase EpsM